MTARVCVARIGAAHGLRGEVRLWTFTEDPMSVTQYGPLSTKDGARQLEVTHARAAKDHLVATLTDVTTLLVGWLARSASPGAEPASMT